MKFFVKTFGCRLNSLDSARLSAALLQAQHIPTTLAQADLVIFNSCLVTQTAEQKLKRAVRQALAKHKKVQILGCAARLHAAALKQTFPQVAIFATEEAWRQNFGLKPAFNLPPQFRTRLPIMVSTGCDNHCTFCVTRLARGDFRSLSEKMIFAQIAQATKLDLKEIVLTGVNLGAFGARNSREFQTTQLPELLTKILHKTPLPRIRLSSLGPEFLQPQFWQVFQNPRLCDFLHLAVQAGSNKILRLMGRPYSVAQIQKVAEHARQVRPNVALGADLIVGFPGESLANFAQTKKLVTELGFAKLHVFPFSPHPETPAAQLPQQIPLAEKLRRARELRALGQVLRQKFIATQLGKKQAVLVEKNGFGWTTNYLPVRIKNGLPNVIYEICLTQENLGEKD